MFIHNLVTALSDSNIPYCIVGGVAVNLYGVKRRTYNVDVVVALDTKTLASLGKTLEALGLRPRSRVRLTDFSDPVLRRRLLIERNLFKIEYFDSERPVREVDIILSPPLRASELIRRAVQLPMAGTAVRIAALNDLIFIKRVSGRLHDADDAARLEQLRRLRRRRSSP